MKTKFWTLVLLGALAVSASAAAQTPVEQVEAAVVQLEEGLSGRKEELAADTEALHQLIDEILLPRFDQRYAGQLVLGRAWRSASADQRSRFVDAFYTSMRNKYADGVLEFDPERLEILPFRGDLTKKRNIVKTVVRLDDGTRVAVNYSFVIRGEDWKIFDVTIEGISYIKNYRTEMAAEIKSSSLDAVIERLEASASASVDDGDSAEATGGLEVAGE